MEAEGFCDDCVKGFLLPGEPKGKMEKIGDLDTYVTTTPAGNKSNKAIILFYDIFGLSTNNNKIIADRISEKANIVVYMPDILCGDWMDPSHLKLPSQPIADKSFFSKVGIYTGLVTSFITSGGIGHLRRNKPEIILPRCEAFAKALRPYGKFEKIGVVGYCFGGVFAIKLANLNQGLVDCAVVAHPGRLAAEDFQNIDIPIAFSLAYEDMGFKPELVEMAKKIITAKPIPSEFVTYPGTTHGFAARPNLGDPIVKKGFYGAIDQTVAWFDKHL